MDVEQHGAARAGQRSAQHRLESGPGPAGPRAAEEDPVRVVILAARHRLDIGGLAFGRAIGRERRARRAITRMGGQRIADGAIPGIFRRRGEIDEEIAVEIDIVLVEPPHPGEAVGVERVDHEHREIRGQARRTVRSEPGNLAGGAAIAFHAMQAGTHYETLGRGRIAEQRGVEMQRPAIRTGLRRAMAGQRGARASGSREEFLAGFGIAA